LDAAKEQVESMGGAGERRGKKLPSLPRRGRGREADTGVVMALNHGRR
jgi:hypothetical protein